MQKKCGRNQKNLLFFKLLSQFTTRTLPSPHTVCKSQILKETTKIKQLKNVNSVKTIFVYISASQLLSVVIGLRKKTSCPREHPIVPLKTTSSIFLFLTCFLTAATSFCLENPLLFKKIYHSLLLEFYKFLTKSFPERNDCHLCNKPDKFFVC